MTIKPTHAFNYIDGQSALVCFSARHSSFENDLLQTEFMFLLRGIEKVMFVSKICVMFIAYIFRFETTMQSRMVSVLRLCSWNDAWTYFDRIWGKGSYYCNQAQPIRIQNVLCSPFSPDMPVRQLSLRINLQFLKLAEVSLHSPHCNIYIFLSVLVIDKNFW